MLILRIKQAECALADGRLDEAFDLAIAQDLRKHRRGQELAGAVARALVGRGREHLDAGRTAQASSDCDKAARLGGNLPEAAELRAAIVNAMVARQQAEQLHAQAVAVAGRQIEQGQLSIGQKLLDGVNDGNGKAAALLQDVAGRRVMIEAIAERVSAALDSDDWESAVDELARARESKLVDSQLRELGGRLSKLLVEKIESAVNGGRLDLATSMHKRLSRVADQSVQGEQLRRTLEQCRLAWSLIERGQPRQAEEILRRLAAVMPAAKWVDAALKNVEHAGEAMGELRAGPLGLLAVSGVSEVATCVWESEAPAEPKMRTRMSATDRNVCPTGMLPEKLLIQVDGVGSFLVLKQNKVTLGPISSSPTPDVALMVESHAQTVTIERVEEDYFVKAPSTVTINDKPQHSKLLANGDRIALSLRCRMSFRRPSAASATAVVDLHSARLSRADVRQVVLMDRELILGPGPSSHIRADELNEAAVLFVRDGQLVCRAKEAMSIDGRPAEKTSAIKLGSHIQVGPVTFVVTAG